MSDGLDESRGSLAANLARIASVPLDRVPGEGWRYSVATDVLGGVIEAVTGTALDGAISTLVTEPLQLGAAFHWPEEDLAVPYHDGKPAPVRMTIGVEVPQRYIEGPGVRFDPERIRDATAWPSGGAGMAGRARDVLTLLEAYRTGAFLSEDLREAARTPQGWRGGPGDGAGMGLFLAGRCPDRPRSHRQPMEQWLGFLGRNIWQLVGIDFARKRSVISMTNTAYEGMSGRFAQSIAAATAMPLS